MASHLKVSERILMSNQSVLQSVLHDIQSVLQTNRNLYKMNKEFILCLYKFYSQNIFLCVLYIVKNQVDSKR